MHRPQMLSLYLTLLVVVLLSAVPVTVEAKEPKISITITVKASPTSRFMSSLKVYDDKPFIQSILKSKTVIAQTTPDLPYAYIRVKRGANSGNYIVDYSLAVFSEDHTKQLQLPRNVRDKLYDYIQVTTKKHYGAMMSWHQVDKVFPRMEKAKVIDVETGLSFMVQRRAGSRHADAQPLSKQDTSVMKEIYGGKWSWTRRAILVVVRNHVIAASMNGMPHGAKGIPGNGFPGHFCIHFDGSITHRGRHHDPGHFLMIRKAAGRLNETILSAAPDELVGYCLTALKEQDTNAARLTLHHPYAKNVEELLNQLEEIQNLHFQVLTSQYGSCMPLDDLNEVSIPVKVAANMHNMRAAKDLCIVVKRDSVVHRWTIHHLEGGLSALFEQA